MDQMLYVAFSLAWLNYEVNITPDSDCGFTLYDRWGNGVQTRIAFANFGNGYTLNGNGYTLNGGDGFTLSGLGCGFRGYHNELLQPARTL